MFQLINIADRVSIDVYHDVINWLLSMLSTIAKQNETVSWLNDIARDLCPATTSTHAYDKQIELQYSLRSFKSALADTDVPNSNG